MGKIEELDRQIRSLPLADICLVVHQAINSGFDKQRLDILLKYLDLAIVKYKLSNHAPSGETPETKEGQ